MLSGKALGLFTGGLETRWHEAWVHPSSESRTTLIKANERFHRCRRAIRGGFTARVSPVVHECPIR